MFGLNVQFDHLFGFIFRSVVCHYEVDIMPPNRSEKHITGCGENMVLCQVKMNKSYFYELLKYVRK